MIFFLLLISVAQSARPKCQDLMGKIANDCVDYPQTPFCVDVSDSDTSDFRCVECQSNCDCEVGYYCMMRDTTTRGQCVLIEDDVIGKPCNKFMLQVEAEFRGLGINPTPILGQNEKMVCGKPVFNSSGDFVYYDWLGSCVRGQCVECDPGTGYPEEYVSYVEENGGLLCQDRTCSEFKFIQRDGPVSTLERMIGMMPDGIYDGIFVFILIIWFTICFGLIVLIHMAWKMNKLPRILYHTARVLPPMIPPDHES